MSKVPDAIVLTGENEPCEVPRSNVYFAFGDGRLDYDCVACGAHCCRGHGYSIGVGPELDRHLTERPAVRFFLLSTDVVNRSRLSVANCPPGCFFLTDDNQCGIHRDHGIAAKPETCRLFPFNKIRRVGKYLVVTPHSSLCPLQILPDGARSERSGHASLFAAMSEQPVGTKVRALASRWVDGDAVVALEREMLASSDRHLTASSYLPFAVWQLKRAREDFARGCRGSDPTTECDDFVTHLCRTLGVVWNQGVRPTVDVVRCLVAMTPSIRAELFFEGNSPIHCSPEELVDRAPKLLIGLWVLAELTREAGVGAVTYQSVMRLYQNNHALLEFLTYLDRPMVWRPAEVVHVNSSLNPQYQTCYLAVLRALIATQRESAGKPLGDVLAQHLPIDGVERMIVLRGLAEGLQGRITPVRLGGGRESQWHRSVRPALQRWLLRKLPNEGLAALARRPRHARAGPARDAG